MVKITELVPGGLLQPGFWGRLNYAALAHAPEVFVIRNNGFANGVPLPLAFANPCLVDFAPAFRIRGARVRQEQLETALQRAHDVCVAGHGPFWLEVLEQTEAEDGV